MAGGAATQGAQQEETRRSRFVYYEMFIIYL